MLGISHLRFAGLLLALFSTSCVARERAAPDVRGPPLSSRSYTADAFALFDDGIEPQAVGASLEPAGPENGRLLRERTRLGDCVARVRVVTITSKLAQSKRSWQIGLHTIERLAGTCGASDFTLAIDAMSPGAGLLQAFDGRLVGTTLVAFLREFARTGGSGEGDLHFHLAGDDRDELHAVRVAALLGEVR
jgi:hypothetical protein